MSGLGVSRFADPVLAALIQNIENAVGSNDGDIASLSTQISNLALQVGNLSPDNVVQDAELTAASILSLIKTVDGAGSGLVSEVANYIEPRNPSYSEADVKLYESFLNSESGELFVCVKSDENNQRWVGQKGTVVEKWISNIEGLLLHYTMENVQGSLLLNEIEAGAAAEIVGAVRVPGVNGNALSFAANPVGESAPVAFVKLPEMSVSGDFTILFNCKIDKSSKDRGVFFGGWVSETNKDFIGYYSDKDKIRVHRNSTNDYDSPAVDIADGWRHFALLRESGKLSLYLDGVFKFEWPYTSGAINIDVLGSYRRDGEGTTYKNIRWDMDDFRFYERALSSDEVAAIFNLDGDEQ